MMASVAHVVMGMVVGRAFGRAWGEAARGQRLAASAGFTALATLPDLDVVGLSLGFRDGGPLGHRGLTHSFAFALALAALVAAVARGWRFPPLLTGLCAFLALGSHGLLDAINYDGGGVPLLWPLSERRFFLPWTPFPAAPKGLAFFSAYGAAVAAVELLCFLPAVLWALWPRRRGALGRLVPLHALCVVAALVATSLVLANTLAARTPVFAYVEQVRSAPTALSTRGGS